jgi:hypothetical protein
VVTLNRKLFFIIFIIFFTIIISNYIFCYKFNNNILYAKTDDKEEKEKKDKSVSPTPETTTTDEETDTSPTSSTQTSVDNSNDNENNTDTKTTEENTGLLNSSSPLNILIGNSTENNESGNQVSTENIDNTSNTESIETNNDDLVNNIDNTSKNIDSNHVTDFSSNNTFSVKLTKNNSIEEAIKTSKNLKERKKELHRSKNTFGFFVIKSFRKKSQSSDKVYDFKTFSRILYFDEKNTSNIPKSTKVENNKTIDNKIEPISIYKKNTISRNYWSTLPLASSVNNNYTKGFGILIILLGFFKFLVFAKK